MTNIPIKLKTNLIEKEDQIFLIYPSNNRKELCDFYINFEEILTKNGDEPFFITNDKSEFQSWKENNLEGEFLPGIKDIWIGDACPFVGENKEGEEVFFLFKYREDYEITKFFLREVEAKNIVNIPLWIDSGSFDFTSKFIFTNQKILIDNKMDTSQLVDSLKEYIDFKDIFFLNQTTDLGHVDISLRCFLDDIVLVDEKADKVLFNFLNKNKIEHIDLPLDIDLSINSEGVENYYGNSFDFILINKNLYFPVMNETGYKCYEKFKDFCKEKYKEINFIPIIIEDLGENEKKSWKKLYELGGGLLCISGFI